MIRQNFFHSFFVFFAVALATFAVLPAHVLALEPVPATFDKILVDDVALTSGADSILSVQRGQHLPIRLEVVFHEAVSNAQVSAQIYGYEYGLLMETSDIFDVRSASTDRPVKKVFTFELELPSDVEGDSYAIQFDISARGFSSQLEQIELEIAQPRRDVVIQEVYTRPGNAVRAGSALFATAHIENFGEDTEEDIRVEINIPELGLRDVDYISALESDDEEDSEEMFFRIPACTQPGVYTLEAVARFANGHHVTEKYTSTIEVLEGDLCQDGLSGTSGSQHRAAESVRFGTLPPSLNAGSSIVLPVTVKNTAATSATHVISLSGVEVFGSAAIGPSHVQVLEPGEQKTFLVTLQLSKKLVTGAQHFTLSVSAGEEVLREETFVMTVLGKSPTTSGSFHTLTLLLIILIALLVVLGILVGFSGRDRQEGSAVRYY